MALLSVRADIPEIMDDLTRPPSELHIALRALGRMNRLSLSAPHLAPHLARLIGNRQSTVRILDLGSGGGDVLCGICERLKKDFKNIEGIGVDMNPLSVDFANSQAKKRRCPASFLVSTALDAVRDLEYDIAISSLFLHHLTDDEIVTMLSTIRDRASLGMVMTDLDRSYLNYGLVKLATNLTSRSKVIRHDGLVSVKRALTKKELRTLTIRAGLANPTIIRAFPFRITAIWQKGIA